MGEKNYKIYAYNWKTKAIELDAYSQVLEKQKQTEDQVDNALKQQMQRLRYQADLAQRQFDQVDPNNRLVASKLEQRWEDALRALKNAETSYETKKKQNCDVAKLPTELKEILKNIGQKLPEIWNTKFLSASTKKALIRCLIDKVVIHRSVRDEIAVRIVWKGKATTTLQIPISVNSFVELSSAKEMEEIILKLASQGISDDEIAKQLTDEGHRSPLRSYVLSSTVQSIRLKHRLLRNPSQSHPRQIPGFLTLPQVAKQIGVSKHWIYDRIINGCIQIVKDHKTKLYLFPDETATIELFQKLKKGFTDKIKFK